MNFLFILLISTTSCAVLKPQEAGDIVTAARVYRDVQQDDSGVGGIIGSFISLGADIIDDALKFEESLEGGQHHREGKSSIGKKVANTAQKVVGKVLSTLVGRKH